VYDLKEKPQVTHFANAMSNRQNGITWETFDSQVPDYRAVFDDQRRMMILICHNTDLGDGWEREGEDDWFFHEFSEKKSYPMAINIIVYAMTH
jgi:hypothetical protein